MFSCFKWWSRRRFWKSGLTMGRQNVFLRFRMSIDAFLLHFECGFGLEF